MDELTISFAAVAGLVALIFALVTADRWHRRRQAHHFAWTMSMLLFTVGSFSLWWATATGWSEGVFRVFFTAGAVLNVAWLALGSLTLLIGERRAPSLRNGLALLSAFAVGVMVVAPTTSAFDATKFPRARDHFGALPRVLAAVGSGVPALIIILGALWSIARLIARRSPALRTADRNITMSPGRLVASNVLIAVGTLVLSASGSLAGRLGEERAFTVTLSIGVIVLFVGFLVPGTRHTPGAARQHLAR